MEHKAESGDRGYGDDRRDQRGKRGGDVRRHGIGHFDFQPLDVLQPTVDLYRKNGDKHAKKQAFGVGKLLRQHVGHQMHLPVDHHLQRGRRHRNKADDRQQAGKQRFNAVDASQLNADKKDRADIEEA